MRHDVPGDVTANANATVRGIGGLTGTLTSNVFGKVAPGNTTGLTTGALAVGGAATMAPSSTFAVELNGAIGGTTYDQLNVTGAVTINNTILNASSTSGLLANQTLRIINFGSITWKA